MAIQLLVDAAHMDIGGKYDLDPQASHSLVGDSLTVALKTVRASSDRVHAGQRRVPGLIGQGDPRRVCHALTSPRGGESAEPLAVAKSLRVPTTAPGRACRRRSSYLNHRRLKMDL